MSGPLLLKFFPIHLIILCTLPQHLLDPPYLSTHATSSSRSQKEKKKETNKKKQMNKNTSKINIYQNETKTHKTHVEFILC